MKRTKKLLALIMSCAMLISLLPTTALAEEDAAEDAAEEIAEETIVQTADLEIAEDQTATVIIGEDAEEESEKDETELTDEAVLDEDAAAADDAEVAEDAAAVEDAEDEAAEPEEVIYMAEKDAVSVKVTAPYGALPEGAELIVKRFAKDSEEYGDAAKAIGFKKDEGSDMAALDISFLVQQEEVEPAAPVKVSIDVSDILPDSADASSLEVQHLVETPDEEIEAVVVANESGATEGKINEEEATAEFEVESFSTFTVTWNDGSGDTIVVHVYNINGTSIDEELEGEEYTFTGDTITISDVVSHLHSNVLYANEYTFQYATVAYQVAQQPSGYTMTIIGGEEDSVTAVSKADTTYTVTHSGTTTDVSAPDDIVIRLYYSIPTVSINTDNAHEDQVNFTTSYAYFQHIDDNDAEVSYTWQLSDDSEGSIVAGTEAGTATYTWAEGAEIGDKETVTVTMTVTYGETQTETASDTYTLTYGDEFVTISVYQSDGVTPQANARVALVDTETGETVATGTTDENGDVTLYAPDGTYTVGVTYVEQTSTIGGGSTSRWTAETVIVTEEGGTEVTLGEAITSGPGGDTNGSNGGGEEPPYYYEHIDVKVAAAQIEGSSASFSDLSHVYVYDKYGNLLYHSEDLNSNPGTTDYNVLFDINDDEDTHSIVVSSEDTIVIVYEVLDEETGEYHEYTASYTGGGIYKSDDYYLPTAINAYQLYNCLYDGNYDSQDEFETAWQNEDITEGVFYDSDGNAVGIAIGGYSYSIIADYLCDTRTTSGQAGLDFVIEVFDAVFEEYDIQIAKTYNDVPESFTQEDLETFTFTLQEIASVTASDDDPEAVWDTNGDNLVNTTTGTTESWTSEDGVWSSIIRLENILEYEAEDGTNFYYYVLSENDSNTTTAAPQYVGIMITVTYSSTTGRTQITASYCTLEKDEGNEGVYNKSGGWTALTEQVGTDSNNDSYDYFEIPFVNTYDAYIDISGTKTWVNDSEDDRPDSITVYLYADDEQVTDEEGNPVTATTTADDDWAWSFTGLQQYQADGETEIEYTVLEGEIEDSSYIPTYEYETDEEGNFTGNVTITNAIPTVEKDVSDPAFGESTDDDLHQDEADNNDTLEYKMEADHIGGAHNLVLHDFLDDQLDISTLEIKSVTLYADENDEGKVLEAGTDYTLYTGECSAECGLEGCSFEIQIIDEDVQDLTSDAYVIVIFDIELHEGVENFDENDVDEIDNFVGLSFTVNNVATYAEPDETETYSYGFDLYKYDADTSEPLAGVEFVLSKAGDDGTVYAQFDATDSTYLLTGWADSKDSATAIVTGSDGKAVVEGLHDGTFSIEETKAPDGYQQKAGTMTVTIAVGDDPVNPTITAANAAVDGMEVQIDNTPGSEDTIELIGSKTWIDGDDEDGVRPDSITIHLLADGEEAGSVTVTADDNWAWSFKDMPRYQDDGTTEVVYTITEDEVDDYDTTVDGLNVTNTHEPEPQDPVKSVDTDGDGEFDDDGGEVEYLDTLTYKIEYYNHNTTVATVTITDELDDALEFVSASDGGVYDEDTRTITWTIENAAPISWGSVTFTAEVNEEGLEGVVIENTAIVQIGNDAAVNTNTVENPTEEGELTESPVPETGAPKTGDTSHPISWLLMLLASIMAIGAALALRKQSRR